jgi:hypothetical protein
VIKKHEEILGKVKSGYEAKAHVTDRQHMKNQEMLKIRMSKAQMKLKTEDKKWQENLHKLDIVFFYCQG